MKRIIIISLVVIVAVCAVLAYKYRFGRVDTIADVPTTSLEIPLMTSEEYDTIEHARPYVLELQDRKGQLLFIGCVHTKDPKDPQIQLIKERWDQFDPTLALLESRLGFYIGGLDGGVEMFSEPGAVYALARRDDVPVFSLEPPIEAINAHLLERFSAQQLAIHYVLGNFISERQGANQSDFEAIVSEAIEKRTKWPGLEGSIRDLDHFESLFREMLPSLGNWRTIPDEATWPGKSDTFLNLISTESSRFRDIHMVRLLDHLVEKGERVFAVVGASHVVMQEPALRGLIR